METGQMSRLFSFTFSALTVCNIYFWIWDYSKFIFMWSPLSFILVCKKSQFWVITLFYEIDTLRLLKIYIILWPPPISSFQRFILTESLFLRASTVRSSNIQNIAADGRSFYNWRVHVSFTQICLFLNTMFIAIWQNHYLNRVSLFG